MSRFILQIIWIFVIVAPVYSQPVIEWQKCYGGSEADYGYCVIPTFDGGYIIAGETLSTDGDVSSPNGKGDAWVVKLNSVGDIEWQNCLGGSGWEALYGITQLRDSSYVATGYVDSNYTMYAWIVNLDKNGKLVWDKKISSASSHGIKETPDGNLIIIGTFLSKSIPGAHGMLDIMVIKLDRMGELIWQKALGGSGPDEGRSIDITSDGGFFIGGISGSNDGDVGMLIGEEDMWGVKTDSLCNVEWSRPLGGASFDKGYGVTQASDSSYIIAGVTQSQGGDVIGMHGESDLWIVKLNELGELVWQRPLGGSLYEIAWAVVPTDDGGCIAAGTVTSDDGDVKYVNGEGDVWLVKLNSDGDLEWEKTYGGKSYECAYSLNPTDDGGTILTGTTISNDANIQNHGKNDVWVLKLSAPVSVEEVHTNKEFQVSPNPASDYIEIIVGNTHAYSLPEDLKIYNSLGECVIHLTPALSEGEGARIDISQLTPGVYFVKIFIGKEVLTGSFMLVK